MVTSSLKVTSQLIQFLASFCGLAYRLGWVNLSRVERDFDREPERDEMRRDEKKKLL